MDKDIILMLKHLEDDGNVEKIIDWYSMCYRYSKDITLPEDKSLYNALVYALDVVKSPDGIDRIVDFASGRSDFIREKVDRLLALNYLKDQHQQYTTLSAIMESYKHRASRPITPMEVYHQIQDLCKSKGDTKDMATWLVKAIPSEYRSDLLELMRHANNYKGNEFAGKVVAELTFLLANPPKIYIGIPRHG